MTVRHIIEAIEERVRKTPIVDWGEPERRAVTAPHDPGYVYKVLSICCLERRRALWRLASMHGWLISCFGLSTGDWTQHPEHGDAQGCF